MVRESFPMTVGGISLANEEELLQSEMGEKMSGPDAVRYIVVHCSATRSNQNFTVEKLMRAHKLRGFRTIGYHFYIRRDGTLTQHRRLLEVGAHCRPYNRCSIGVCYEGGLLPDGTPADTRTEAQHTRLLELIRLLHELFPTAIVAGHRDMPGAVPKECPCFDCSGLLDKALREV